MTLALPPRLTVLTVLLAGCPAYPVMSGAAESETGSSSSDDDGPPGGIPTGTDTDDAPAPGTTGEATGTESSTGSVGVVVCGDGVVDPDEGCDDGVGNGPNAACTDACQPNVCGDGDVHARQGPEVPHARARRHRARPDRRRRDRDRLTLVHLGPIVAAQASRSSARFDSHGAEHS